MTESGQEGSFPQAIRNVCFWIESRRSTISVEWARIDPIRLIDSSHPFQYAQKLFGERVNCLKRSCSQALGILEFMLHLASSCGLE